MYEMRCTYEEMQQPIQQSHHIVRYTQRSIITSFTDGMQLNRNKLNKLIIGNYRKS